MVYSIDFRLTGTRTSAARFDLCNGGYLPDACKQVHRSDVAIYVPTDIGHVSLCRNRHLLIKLTYGEYSCCTTANRSGDRNSGDSGVMTYFLKDTLAGPCACRKRS